MVRKTTTKSTTTKTSRKKTTTGTKKKTATQKTTRTRKSTKSKKFIEITLSDEQKYFIDEAVKGNNILVDACIGSGKTTAIQHLCNTLPATQSILYLTYNKLLKIDARAKIKNKNVTVTNYHGLAYQYLSRMGVRCGISDLIQSFNRYKPEINHYDVMVIDEYQDIELEFAEMLLQIKKWNPDMQIIAVGDMAQKIYDKTTLNVREWIDTFLGDYIQMEFTQCFRLSADIAADLGEIWSKKIVGVNPNCEIKSMGVTEAIDLMAKNEPRDILCLGQRTGNMAGALNLLEKKYPEKFNKYTVWASISDKNSDGATQPSDETAIFTTYDSSKGMERKICVIFDYDINYWHTRLNKPQASYDILRNIFCVAASRGKEQIIFVKNMNQQLTKSEIISSHKEYHKFVMPMDISDMFSFKYKEDIEECFNLLKTKRIQKENTDVINIKRNDALIDLSPCIGEYQEYVFFKHYDIDVTLQRFFDAHPDMNHLKNEVKKKGTIEEKILLLTSMETGQNRYRYQVKPPLATEEQKESLIDRLKEELSPMSQNIQVPCAIGFSNGEDGPYKEEFTALGIVDAIKDDTVYELKFVRELTHEMFLQCACYMVALDLPNGILWNTLDNTMYEIKVPDRAAFLDKVAKTITKHRFMAYAS